MKKNKKKTRKPLDMYLEKYEFGSGMVGGQQIFDVASDALMGMTAGSIASLASTISGRSPHPKTFDFSANQNPIMANGGMFNGLPNAEVEGEEVYETPNGEVGEFQGPKHKDGGIPVNLEKGTKIFSERLKKAGKSMADRKLAREKAITKLENALKETPHDKILKQTLERVKEKNAIEEQGDMMIQESMNAMQNAEGMMNYMQAYGGKVGYNYAHGGVHGLPKYFNGGPVHPSMPGSPLFEQMYKANMPSYFKPDYTFEDVQNMPQFQGKKGVKKIQQAIKDYQQGIRDENIKLGRLEDFGLDDYDIGKVDNIAGSNTRGFFDDSNRREAFMQSLGYKTPPTDAGGAKPGFHPFFREFLGTTPIDAIPALQSTTDFLAAQDQALLDEKIPDLVGQDGFEDVMKMIKHEGDQFYTPEDTDFMQSNIDKFLNVDGTGVENLFDKTGNIPLTAQGLTSSDINLTDDIDADKPLTGQNLKTDDKSPSDLLGYDFTPGDLMGMAGTKIAGLGPLMTTIINRAGDTPNINAFLNYGKDTINTIEAQKGMVGRQSAEALKDIGLKSATLRKQQRGSARSVNTLRALNELAGAQEQEMVGNVYANKAQQLMGIMGQKAQAQAQRDKMVMSGEQARDLADRQDRDNFFTQLNQDIVNYGTATQKLGKDLNVKEGDKDFMELLPHISQYGLSFRKDKNGKWEMFHQASKKKASPKEVQDAVKKAKEDKASTKPTDLSPMLDIKMFGGLFK